MTEATTESVNIYVPGVLDAIDDQGMVLIAGKDPSTPYHDSETLAAIRRGNRHCTERQGIVLDFHPPHNRTRQALVILGEDISIQEGVVIAPISSLQDFQASLIGIYAQKLSDFLDGGDDMLITEFSGERNQQLNNLLSMQLDNAGNSLFVIRGLPLVNPHGNMNARPQAPQVLVYMKRKKRTDELAGKPGWLIGSTKKSPRQRGDFYMQYKKIVDITDLFHISTSPKQKYNMQRFLPMVFSLSARDSFRAFPYIWGSGIMAQQRITEKQKEIYILSMTARILGQLKQKGIVVLGGPAKNRRFKDKEILSELYASVVNAEEKCIILQKVNIVDFPDGNVECRKLIILAHSDLFLKEKTDSHTVDKKELKDRFASRKAKPLETGIMGEHLTLIQSDLYVCKAPAAVFVKRGNLPIEREFPIMNLFPDQSRDETISLYVRKEGLPVDA